MSVNLKILLVCLADVIVFGSTFEQTFKWLEIELEHLGKFGLQLKALKCKIFHMTLSYVGQVVLALAVSPDSGNFNALKELLQHPPKS